MDLQNPLRTVAPTVESDVLAVLAQTQRPLTGAAIERLAGRSHAQVLDVLRRLVRSGLVDADRVGNAVQYRMNRDHVLASGVEQMLSGAQAVEARLQEFAASCLPAPEAVVLFGSFARRDGDSDSDIDVLVIRPDAIHTDDSQWAEVRLSIAKHLERWTGNRCQVVELSVGELRKAALRREPLVESLRQEGREIFGKPLSKVLGQRGRLRTQGGG
jgi:predicted nucleotidyltransferase